MKKIYIFFIIVIAILCTFWYIIYVNKNSMSLIKSNNTYYESFKDKEINGIELATIINRIYNQNSQNNIKKNDNGLFIDDNEKSLNLEISFKEAENVIHYEKIYENGTSKFVELYSNVKFKCDKIEYHEKSKYVKYIHFTEI